MAKTAKLEAKKVYFRNVEAVGCSHYGNPKYEGEMVLQDGTTICGKTATDASCAYGFRNYEAYTARESREIDGETWYREVEKIPRYADVKYHITKGGQVLFDYITEHKED